jgi:hypothetical protein
MSQAVLTREEKYVTEPDCAQQTHKLERTFAMLHETLLTKSDNLKNKLERIYYWFTHVQLVKYKHNILNRRITHRVSTMIQILTTNIYSFYLQVLEKVLLVLSALAREARQLLKDQNST